MSSIVFDIETGPVSDEELQAIFQPPEPPAHPGKFDPDAVKIGNIRDPAKAKAKVDDARQKHEQKVVEHEALLKSGPAEAFAEFKSKAALDARTGMVLAVGIMDIRGMHQIFTGDEQDVLANIWSSIAIAESMGGSVIGFNSNGFDLPFLIRRSWKLGVDVPAFALPKPWFGRPFVDLRDAWQCGNRQQKGKLEEVGEFFGLKGKLEGVDGSMFAELFATDRAKAIEYLVEDLRLTLQVAQAMQVL